MNEFVLISGMALVTFAVRYPVLALIGRINLPTPVLRALKYVPVAVLTAIIVPAALIPQGQLNLSPANAHMSATLIAALIAWRTRNLLWTIVGGMAAFYLIRFLAG